MKKVIFFIFVVILLGIGYYFYNTGNIPIEIDSIQEVNEPNTIENIDIDVVQKSTNSKKNIKQTKNTFESISDDILALNIFQNKEGPKPQKNEVIIQKSSVFPDNETLKKIIISGMEKEKERNEAQQTIRNEYIKQMNQVKEEKQQPNKDLQVIAGVTQMQTGLRLAYQETNNENMFLKDICLDDNYYEKFLTKILSSNIKINNGHQVLSCISSLYLIIGKDKYYIIGPLEDETHANFCITKENITQLKEGTYQFEEEKACTQYGYTLSITL